IAAGSDRLNGGETAFAVEDFQIDTLIPVISSRSRQKDWHVVGRGEPIEAQDQALRSLPGRRAREHRQQAHDQQGCPATAKTPVSAPHGPPVCCFKPPVLARKRLAAPKTKRPQTCAVASHRPRRGLPTSVVPRAET